MHAFEGVGAAGTTGGISVKEAGSRMQVAGLCFMASASKGVA